MHPKSKANPTAPSPNFLVKAITILCFASLLVSFVAYRSGFMDGNVSSASMIDGFGRSGLDSNITPSLTDSNFVIDKSTVAPSSKSGRVFEPTTIMSSSKSMDMRRDVRIKDPDTSKKPTTRPITIMGGSKSGTVLSPAQQKRQEKKRKRQEKKNNKRKEANTKNNTKKRIMHSSKSGAMIEPRD
ncbi:MAG: hypothetical protein GY810_06465 [Aureispira sp.]|nr:hypothetical protein [Aureispira sp.]